MTLRRHFAVASLMLLGLVVASCSTRRPARRPLPSVPPLAKPSRVASPAAFVATAASIDLYVVRASEMALVRSSAPRIRTLAEQLRAGHRGLAAQLSLAGRRLNALPAARLLPREEARLAWLDTQVPFDVTFVRQMALTHEQSIALHSAFAARGSSPTLRPVAANGERVERAHFALLRGR